jgi:Fur family ferric uptake transcriptional regulator
VIVRQRHTRQRAAIMSALETSPHPCTPEELLEAAQQRVAGIGMATVYRAIRDLCDEGRLHAVALPGAAPRYELAGRGHHHHFECHGCHKVFHVDGCAHDLARLAPAGFTLEGHEIVLYGRCPACAAEAKSA